VGWGGRVQVAQLLLQLLLAYDAHGGRRLVSLSASVAVDDSSLRLHEIAAA
jgi:hypothetical protein